MLLGLIASSYSYTPVRHYEYSYQWIKEMTNSWIDVDSYDDIPIGEWLVALDSDCDVHHIATVIVNSSGQKLVIIGNYFHFDMNRVIAYRGFEKYSK